ncbi:MAG: class I SAM-dependent methyltransferase [Candidatus Buchananbacteria bacterium]|nr:class I SAM-dependent methyltransferase [Candidatus Buchananbacteria bacterium]
MIEDKNKDFSTQDYFAKVYVNKDRWVSYYWQTKLVSDLITSGSVLEIGVGNALVADYLKHRYQVSTLDINDKLNPDYIGSVEDLSFLAEKKFDVVVCAEVLEHLPFEKFKQSLQQMHSVSRRHVVISLPYWGYTFYVRIKLPKLGKHTFQFKLNGFKRHRFNGQHYWEIGKRGYSVKKIKDEIVNSGFKIKTSFWDVDDPYHYYFVLEK